MHIFADGFSKISFSNNNLRITLTQNGPENTMIEAGTLIIPANMAAGFINSLTNGIKQLEEQVKAKAEESQGKKGETLQ
jgi:hypothetical protein